MRRQPDPTIPGRRLDEWLDHIGRVHFRSIDLTLDRVRRVAHVMGLPDRARYVAVAGTNGKGSSVAYLEAIYRAAGYRTGAYTSPHLVRYNERVRIDGVPVRDELLEQAFASVESARNGIPLTYFEFGTLAALAVFRELTPDIVVLEVGMGGRLDAVNIIDADIALITEIGLDHQQWLGDSVEKIAREKAGVFRHGGRAVSSGARPPATLARVAEQKRCALWQLGVEFGYELREDDWDWLPLAVGGCPAPAAAGLPIPAGGLHQVNNAAGAVAVARRLQDLLPVTDAAISDGIARAQVPGRLQHVAGEPELVFDVSHNPDGLAVLSSHLRAQPPRGRQIGVFSMLADKDIAAAVRQVDGLIDHWVVAPVDNERAAGTALLRGAIAAGSDASVDCVDNVSEAIDHALAMAGPDDRVVVFGSFYAVGDIMRHLHIDPYPGCG